MRLKRMVSFSREGKLVSEPRAVATGSYAQLSQNLYFVSLCLIRSLPLAVLTQLVATRTSNAPLPRPVADFSLVDAASLCYFPCSHRQCGLMPRSICISN